MDKDFKRPGAAQPDVDPSLLAPFFDEEALKRAKGMLDEVFAKLYTDNPHTSNASEDQVRKLLMDTVEGLRGLPINAVIVVFTGIITFLLGCGTPDGRMIAGTIILNHTDDAKAAVAEGFVVSLLGSIGLDINQLKKGNEDGKPHA